MMGLDELKAAYLDPDLWAMFDALPRDRYNAEALPAAREVMAELGRRMSNPPPGSSISRREVIARGLEGEPPVRLLVYEPPRGGGPKTALLHLHGGGFVSGSAEIMAPDHFSLAEELGCIIVAVDYRLSPETAYPGPLNDAHAALLWLFDNAAELGGDPARIGIAGESAGGGLAAGLALKARDEGLPALSFLHLIYPMLDDRTCTRPDPYPWSDLYTWTENDNRFGWKSFLGTLDPGSPDVPKYAAPSRERDLSGLPRTYIATGTLELFMAEGLDFASRLLAAGVPVEFHLYPGAFHGFQRVPDARVTAKAEKDRRDSLRRLINDNLPTI